MYAKTITYTDFNDVERTETIHFNLSKTELSKMAATEGGGFGVRLQRMMDAKDIGEILDTITFIIEQSYGVKSDDGRYFRKSPEYLADFKDSPLYDEFWMMLMNDEDTISDFIIEVMPKDMRAEIQSRVSNLQEKLSTEVGSPNA